MQKQYLVIIGVSMFFTALFSINAIHSFNEKLNCHTEQARGPKALDLLADRVPAIWEKKVMDEDYLKTLNETELNRETEKQFESGVTREQLGNAGWLLLHMISATLPKDFDGDFVFKINVFLNLFGQFYPCKECAGHFLEMITQNPYDGATREDFMQYMCMLHNIVNERLHKPLFNCSAVHDKWGGYCGCAEELQKSINKYAHP